MKLIFLAILLTTTILLTGTIVSSASIQYADAIKGQGVSSSSYGSKTKGMICGDRLCSEIPGGRESWEKGQGTTEVVIPDYGLEQKNMLQKETEKFQYQKSDSAKGSCQCTLDGCNCAGCNCSEDGMCTCHGDSHQCSCGGHGVDGTCAHCGMTGDSHGMSTPMKSITGTIQSETDPGKGHEQHQLAVLLPPSEKMYKGLLTYSASENVQLVALHGPLTDDEVMGQTTWTPDGKTKFALTLVDQQNKMGTWMFTGNALAVHAFSTEPFDITYSIVTMGGDKMSVHEKRSHGATCDCAADCNCSEDGTCTCSGEAGPCMCGPNCTCGADGTCQCAEGCSCDQGGACICSGEAGPCMCGPNCNCGQ